MQTPSPATEAAKGLGMDGKESLSGSPLLKSQGVAQDATWVLEKIPKITVPSKDT